MTVSRTVEDISATAHINAMGGDRRYALISTDGHCGADLWDYKPYLESRYHDEFDAWASEYHDAWAERDADAPVDRKRGSSSSATALNWDSDFRLRYTEAQGIAGEVLFPNTTPPFYPSNAITAPGPRDARDLEYRSAGLAAHNRWLSEFCAATPGRRAGLAQIFLNDVDWAVSEIQQAQANGLKGVLLPSDHVLTMANLYYASYDPIWRTCSELGLAVHRHGVRPTESNDISGPAGAWIANLEVPFYGLRAIAHLICSGVFERFPDLKLVSTEINEASAIPEYLARIDNSIRAAEIGALGAEDVREPAAALSRPPSAYFESNCYVGNPFDLGNALLTGVPNQMWGADIPHAEGCSPYTAEALRLEFAGLPEELTDRVLTEYAIEVYGFDLALMRSVAQRIGPLITDVHSPLTADELPDYPRETRCPTFGSDRVANLIGVSNCKA